MQHVLALLNRVRIGSPRIRMAHGWLVPGSLDRLVATLAWKLGWLEARERRFIESVVREGMTVVDVGANIGFHTLTLAHAVGPTGCVHAIEPEPSNFRALSRATELSGFSQVQLHQAAATDRPGPIPLYLSAAHHGDHRISSEDDSRRMITVSGLVLDDLLADERVDFVKVDVQGAESAVLHGLERSLRGNPDMLVLCEVSPRLLTRAGSSKGAFFEPIRGAGLFPHLLDSRSRLESCDEDRLWELAERSGFVNAVFKRS